MTRPTAAVIGAGLAGLAAARELAADHDVIVLERSGHVGGMICPVELGGVTVDAGAEAYATRGGVVDALMAELGLTAIDPQGGSTVWWPDGSLPDHPAKGGTFRLATGVLGIPASMKDPALEALNNAQRDRVARDLHLDASVGADSQTVAELVAARMGRAAVDILVAPLARSVYQTPPDRMRLVQFAPGMLDALAAAGSLMGAVERLRGDGAPQIRQPDGGMFQLVNALADDARDKGVDIRLRSQVAAIRPGADGPTVVVADGSEIPAQRVVLAATTAECARLLRAAGVDVVVPDVHAANLALLALREPRLAWGPVGSGLLVGKRDDRVLAKALTHYSSKWPWARRDGVEIVRLSYPADVDVTRERVLADAGAFLRLPLSDEQLVGFVAGRWSEMPGRVSPEQQQATVDAARAIGVDVAGAWIDGNGMAPIIQGLSRLGSRA